MLNKTLLSLAFILTIAITSCNNKVIEPEVIDAPEPIDTVFNYVKDRFAGVTTLAVECNHIEDILSENIKKSSVHAMVGRRARRNHMSFGTLINFIKANNWDNCREIHLLHLSDANSDEARMIEEVQEVTGIPTYAA